MSARAGAGKCNHGPVSKRGGAVGWRVGPGFAGTPRLPFTGAGLLSNVFVILLMAKK